MGLFTKANCAECGNPATPIMRVKLQDGNYVCSKCSQAIPYYAYKSYLEVYDFEAYRGFKEYRKFSDQELRPIFEETMHYYTIHVDEVHHLFYIGYGIDKNTVFLRMEDTVVFDIIFKPKELKSGITGQKVEGDVLFQLAMRVPYFIFEDKLAKDVKANAKKELFGSKISFVNPKGMDEFCNRFAAVWMACTETSEQDDSQQSQPSELQQAMALFMLDSLDDITLSDLKSHRNRMIKAFHPDKGGAETDTRYAQKINNAYEILRSHLERNS